VGLLRINMSDTFTMYKQCGKSVEVSEPSIAHAIKLGWSDKPPVKSKGDKNVGNSRKHSK
jgi:hypothetical protein